MEAPPKLAPSLSPGWFAGLVLGGVFLGVCAVVFFFNPVHYGFYPICRFHQLTGLYCPGCGGTRSLYALLHGDLRAAWQDNALFILTLPVAGLRAGWLGIKKLQGRAPGSFVTGQQLWIFLGVMVAFAVVRNLPGFEWLRPAP